MSYTVTLDTYPQFLEILTQHLTDGKKILIDMYDTSQDDTFVTKENKKAYQESLLGTGERYSLSDAKKLILGDTR